MPSTLPNSFASAAAGQSRAPRSSMEAGNGGGGGDWRDGRAPNTRTFRRPNTATSNNQSQHQSDAAVHGLAQDFSHMSGAPSSSPDGSARYSKEQMLRISKGLELDSDQRGGIEALLSALKGSQTNGNSSRGWAKNDAHSAQDSETCLQPTGHSPLNYRDLTDVEKEMFSDVNSPLKQQQPQKDSAQGGANGRKASVSGSNYPLSSPSTASRPSTRRRETTDSNPFAAGGGLISPTSTGRFRDESWLSRKPAESKEAMHQERDDESHPPSASVRGFGSLLRSNTSGGVGYPAPTSPWSTSTGLGNIAAPGAFGKFALPSASADKRLPAPRGESRFAHLLSKDSANNTVTKGIDTSDADMRGSWRSRQRTDTDPYVGEEQSPVSQALGGQESLQYQALSQHAHPFETPIKGSAEDFGMAGLNLGANDEIDVGDTPETNPYRSPAGDLGETEQRQPVADKLHMGPFGAEPYPGMSAFSRGFPGAVDAGDRSQTSSVGAKGFASTNPLGTWPSNFMSGTPDRERPSYGTAFGTSLFSGDLQSPGGFGGISSVFGSGGAGLPGTGSIKGSKMNALFPTSMHAKQEKDSLGDSIPDLLRQANPLGAIGGGSIGLSAARDPDSAMRPGRPSVEDFFSETMSPTIFSNIEQTGQAFHAAQALADVGQAQTKSMVMPDRMRWHYLDPQGEMQGPFTGLEMNDWYKANFFTPDLRVKKLEDEEFEPLGQLIRRIGNSREPFLVPMMGVPHGEPSPSGPFGATGDRGVIPPLMGAFPSFGRTLTADEQNNLERRKQEEQFLQARHRELQIHGYPKMQVPISGSQGPLHHHSSAQSLHSQPSFGSITSPMTTQGPIGGVLGQGSGFFDQASRLAQGTRHQGLASGEDLISDDLNMGEREMLASFQQQQPPATTGGLFHGAIAAPVSDLASRGGLPALSELKQDNQGFSERLKQFKELRAEREADEMNTMASLAQQTREESIAQAQTAQHVMEQVADLEDEMLLEESRALSLTQQVQNTQAAAEAAKFQAEQDVWESRDSTTDPSMPMPFPPPLEQTNQPLPAPKAQRTRSTLPDQYAASRSQSETPESSATGSAVQPPPLAPWARDMGSEGQKGPSLKEIQEAEAKKAAKAEEIAAAARRVAAEVEAAAQRDRERAGLAVAPGLPTSSTWGNGTPVGTASSSSAWVKPGPVKSGVSGTSPAASSLTADKKRTIAEIQREEEKQKQKQIQKRPAQQTTGAVTAAGMGTRYADLASKAQPLAKTTMAANILTTSPSSIAPPPGSGWNVVGAGGKPRVGSIPTAPGFARSVSATGVKPVAQAPVRPVIKQSASISKAESGSAANEEIKKWLARELARGISVGVDVNNTVSLIMSMPIDDPATMEDVIYSVTQTVNARHLVEELVRRRKLADKGIIEKQPATAGTADNKGSGWSEVAKKGGNPAPKEDTSSMPAGFKVVPGRKKGKK